MSEALRISQRMTCALCGRATFTALVFVAGHPVGPKCARRAGLVALAERGAGMVTPGLVRRSTAVRIDQLELSL
jgi:hypothetical protein